MVVMSESYDRDKVVECMFDPVTSSLISELEDGPKDSKFLSEKSSITENELEERLSYLIEHGFIIKKTENEKLPKSGPKIMDLPL